MSGEMATMKKKTEQGTNSQGVQPLPQKTFLFSINEIQN